MGARNGKTVFELIQEGWKRTVFDRKDGYPGVGIPADYANEHNITPGDDVVIKEADNDDGVLELHFDDDAGD